MLNLTRRPGESIRLHTVEGVVEIYVCELKGLQVKIGIDAPPQITILRSEIDDTLNQSNQAA